MYNLCEILNFLLQTIASLTIPPTFIARFLFLFFSTITFGVSFVEDVKFINNYPYPNACEKIPFCKCQINNLIIYLAIETIQLINSDLNSDILEDFNKNKIPSQIQNSKVYMNFLASNEQTLLFIKNQITKYYEFRNQDPWKTSNESIELPNGNYRIEPNKPIDVNSIVEPNIWCPLQGQKMIGSKWSLVPGLINTRIKDKIIYELTSLFDRIDINKESAEVLDISLNLNDKQKCIAEFWAGISGSVSPPGFWNMFMLCCFKNTNQYDYLRQLDCFYQLNCGLFQGSLIVWDIKYKCLQARPIQTIRLNFPNVEFEYYFGKGNGETWLPYQESILFTPPFPDFISGHSSFSSIGAFFMEKFFGKNVKDLDVFIDSNELKLLSPIYRDYQGNPLNLSLLVFEPNCSNIQPNVPVKPIYLEFDTWESMAESAGVSRIFGGIHYSSSNLISLDTGKKIAELISAKFDN
jgi:hypothetical protein